MILWGKGRTEVAVVTCRDEGAVPSWASQGEAVVTRNVRWSAGGEENPVVTVGNISFAGQR